MLPREMLTFDLAWLATLWGGARGGGDVIDSFKPSSQFIRRMGLPKKGGGFVLQLCRIGFHLWFSKNLVAEWFSLWLGSQVPQQESKNTKLNRYKQIHWC
jgi:hypothetical protein